jgi:hypothetical protein
MNLRMILAGGLCLCALCCSPDHDEPTSSIRSAALPDLTIVGVTYSYDLRTPGWISIEFTLRIQNIGQASFDSLLYVGWTGSKYAVAGGYYSQTALVNYDWSGPSVRAIPIAPGEVIEAKASDLAILDTNVVRFRIITDRRGLSGDAGQFLPLVPEANYENNDFTLAINPP